MEWWGWIAMGFFLMIGELLTPGAFFLLFFGIGALVVGILTGIDLLASGWLQWVLFGLISPVLTVLFRRGLLSRFISIGDPSDRSGLIGETVVISNRLEIGESGKGELRGAPWSVKNVGNSTLSVNDTAKVIKVSGMTLEVEEI